MLIKTELPQRSEQQETKLTNQEKIVGVCLLLLYLAMIGVTIATSPYVMSGPSRSIFERATGSF